MISGPLNVVAFECTMCSRIYSTIKKGDYYILVDDSIFVSKSGAICLHCLPNIELIYV